MSRFLISESITTAESLQIPIVSATGGEPFLWPEGIKYFIDLAAKRKVKWRVITNGFWGKGLSRPIEQTLDDMAIADNGGLSISVDRYHAEFIPLLHIRAATDQCKKRGIPVELNVTIDRHPSTLNILKEIAGWGLPIALASVASVGRAKEINRNLLFDQIQIGGCDTVESPFVRWDGLVTACCGANRAMFEKSESRLVLGNATEMPLSVLLAKHNTPIIRALKMFGPYNLAQKRSTLENGSIHDNFNYKCDNYCELCLDLTSDVDSLFLSQDLNNPDKIRNNLSTSIPMEGLHVDKSIELIHFPCLSQGYISSSDHLPIAGLIAFRSEYGQEYQIADERTFELLEIAKHEGWEGVMKTVGKAINQPQDLQAYMSSITRMQQSGIFRSENYRI